MAVARRAVRAPSSNPVHSDVDEVEALSLQVQDLQKAAGPSSRGSVLSFSPAAAGVQTAKHKLGRVPGGWQITRLLASDSDAPVISERSSDNVSISFHFSTGCRATILVY
jgi:hypothetical protein